MTDTSSRDVGVSALYSSIFGGDLPSYARSKRPYTLGGSSFQLFVTSGMACSGILNSA
jgi:hypothetical protein